MMGLMLLPTPSACPPLSGPSHPHLPERAVTTLQAFCRSSVEQPCPWHAPDDHHTALLLAWTCWRTR